MKPAVEEKKNFLYIKDFRAHIFFAVVEQVDSFETAYEMSQQIRELGIWSQRVESSYLISLKIVIFKLNLKKQSILDKIQDERVCYNAFNL